MYSNRSHFLEFCRLAPQGMRGQTFQKTRGTGSDSRRKEARAARAEQARLAEEREEATEIWNKHYDEMDAIKVANKNLQEEIEECRAHTQAISDHTNGLEFEAAAQRALHERVMQEHNELRGTGQQWVTATHVQRDTIEQLRQEITQAQRELVCEEESYLRDKCEVQNYRDELDARRRAEANAEEL